MSTPEENAFESMVSHHRSMVDELRALTSALVDDADHGRDVDASSTKLVTYLNDEVLPHATAEENSLYRAAAGIPSLSATLPQMIDEHRELASLTRRLAEASSDPATHARAPYTTQIFVLFVTHAAKENDIVLPAVLAEDGVDLSGLLHEMHSLLAGAT
ncbi:MAG: hemerythrin domain-containing protein [Acidimicrobiales bacterium]|jgi:hemerythrin-like domain-containing protein